MPQSDFPPGNVAACSTSPPKGLAAAIAQFNAGQYFKCHETLEAVWLADASPARDLYKGVIQIAAGLYHWGNGNDRGCRKLLSRGIGYVNRFSPRCQGIDVAALVVAARRALAWCEAAAPGTPLPADLVPRIVPAD